MHTKVSNVAKFNSLTSMGINLVGRSTKRAFFCFFNLFIRQVDVRKPKGVRVSGSGLVPECIQAGHSRIAIAVGPREVEAVITDYPRHRRHLPRPEAPSLPPR